MNKKINVVYVLAYFFYFSLTAAVYGFGLYTLIERGYTSGQAGTILAISNFVGFILQPFLSNLSDSSNKFDPFSVSFISVGLIIIFSIFNTTISTNGLLLTIVFIGMVSSFTTTEPLLNSFSGKFEKSNIKINFSLTRAAGSLSYAILCFVLGKLTVIYSYPSVNITMCIASIVLMIILFILRSYYKKIKVSDENEEKKEIVSYKEFMANNKPFLQVMFFVILIYLAFSSFDNFMLIVIEPLGGNSSDMGNILSFKAIVEMVGMIFIFPILQKKLSLEKILILSAVCFAIKITMQAFAPSLFWMYAAHVLTCLSFSTFMPGMVMYINRYMEEKEITRGQAAFTMAVSFGNICSSLLGGLIAEKFGVKTMEYLAVVIVVIGAIGFIYYINKIIKNGK